MINGGCVLIRYECYQMEGCPEGRPSLCGPFVNRL